MNLSYKERQFKQRIVTEYMGFEKPADLLASYRNKAIVPGICTEAFCDCIITVECDQEAGWCPHCNMDTIQSIYILSPLN